MSYLLEVDKVDNTTKIEKSDGSSLMLLRAVAKIVVVNEASNFELEGVSAVANVPRQGQLHNLIPASIMGNAGNDELSIRCFMFVAFGVSRNDNQ